MLRFFAAFALVAASLLVAPVRAAEPPQSWLVLSDIHFNPFTQPRLVERLQNAPPDRWRDIFLSGEATAPSGPGRDTNYALLESALDGARNAAPDPRVVIIAGDFLAHGFRKRFERVTKTHDEAAYDAFVDKTIGFLAWEIESAFPRAHLLPVVGNNDGYCGDYESTPHAAFLARMAAAWAASVDVSHPNAFIAQFSTGGYYTVPLPIDDAKAVVLNDVFWSARYSNACGSPHDDPGANELAWLRSTLASIGPHVPVWVIAHIPPGIDVFSSLHGSAGAIPVPLAVPFLNQRFNDAYVAALDDSGTVMAIAGHTHMDGFRIAGPDPSTPRVPMLVVPSISPVFGNAPAFTVLSVDPVSAQVDDSQVFALTRDRANWVWRREYDFDSIYGRGAIDAAHLWSAQNQIFDDERVRRRFEEYYEPGGGSDAPNETTWRAYWCGDVALDVTPYAACATPQIQHDLPAQPSPPPPPTPSPSPSPSASPSPSPSP